jgi:hypothetical protein
MKVLDRLEGAAVPIDYRVDVQQLRSSVEEFVAEFLPDDGERAAELKSKGCVTLNLSHMPRTKGAARVLQYRGNHEALNANSIHEKDFVNMVQELEGTYLGKVIRDIEALHHKTYGVLFSGRYQLSWVNPGFCFPLHKDFHTPHRYHVPIETNSECWWVFRHRTEVSCVHMPADGRVWYLDPVQQEHSVANLGTTPRLHLLMTSSVK